MPKTGKGNTKSCFTLDMVRLSKILALVTMRWTDFDKFIVKLLYVFGPKALVYILNQYENLIYAHISF